MRIVVLENPEAVAQFGAQHIAQQIARKPKFTLGLATGSSPISLYQNLIRSVSEGTVSFKDVTTFNLDEYLGLDEKHPQSYRQFMNEQLFNQIDIDESNTHVPDGSTTNPIKTCEQYEQLIHEQGGIDLQLLGLGRNGHIGFNEPTSSLVSRTRVKTLTKDTIQANKKFFAEDEFQPYLSLTMGIGTIMEAREVLLIATGADKADAVKNAIEGPLAARCPASILQMHAKAVVVIDQDAALGLQDVAFYQYIEQENQRLVKAMQHLG